MDVNLIFRIAAVGILVSVICQVLKHSGRDEQAFLTSLAGLVMVLFWMIPYIYDPGLRGLHGFMAQRPIFRIYITYIKIRVIRVIRA